MQTNTSKRPGLVLACILCLAALNAIVYYPSLWNGFVFDDHPQILNNPLITDFKHLYRILTSGIGYVQDGHGAAFYRPVHFSFYMAEYHVFGLAPFGWHLVNVVIHFLNAVMVFLTTRLILRETGASTGTIGTLGALAGAAVFSTHPAGSEAVAWVGCIPELVFTFLSVSAFYLYAVAYDSNSTAKKAALVAMSVAAYFVADFSKEPAIVLPAFLFIFDLAAGRLRGTRGLIRYVPYVGAALAYVILRGVATGETPPMEKFYPYLGWGQYFLNLFPLSADYLVMFFFPFFYTPFKVFEPVLSLAEPRAFVSVAVILAATGATLYLVVRRRLSASGVLALAVMVLPALPALYVINLSPTPQADRYLYFSGFGLAIAVALAISHAASLERARWASYAAGVLAVVLISAFSIESVGRTKYWANDIDLWNGAVAASPENYFAHHFLGVSYIKNGMVAEALPEFERSAALNSARAHPDELMLVRTLKALALVHWRSGRLDEAASVYAQTLKTAPEDFEATSNLATVLFDMGDFNRAAAAYEAARGLARTPVQTRETLRSLANAYYMMGSKDKAAAVYREALALFPDDSDFMEKAGRPQ